LQYIPTPNNSSGTFATSSYNQKLRDDKGGVRLDTSSRWGLLSAYYFFDDYDLDNPHPTAQSGASVPGFNALTKGRAQLIALGDTKTLNATAVNELHLSYTRDYTDLGKPIGGRNVSLASQGFVNADGSPSIVALDPKGQGVENIVFNSFSIGAAANELTQANNAYGVTDTFTKVLGNHSIKFGGDFHLDQVNANAIAQFNGNFIFSGSETGSDFADFLIGVPSQYNQSQLNPFYSRNKYVGLFGQDSWHVLPSLTLNYGLRWDRIAPWTEKYNQISTFVPGAQSVVFLSWCTCGYSLSDRSRDSSASRPDRQPELLATCWSVLVPQASSDGLLGKVFGAPGSTSIRVGFGTFTLRSRLSPSVSWPPMPLTAPRIRAPRLHSSLHPSLRHRTARTLVSRSRINSPV
jgi:hypothetical protein